MGGVIEQWQEHLNRHDLDLPPVVRSLFPRWLAVFALHAASRPKQQVLAWTINIQQPLVNLFFAADTDLDSVTGRAFTENVRQGQENRFYQDFSPRGKPVMRSICLFSGADPFLAGENFYRQSEQRPARFFQMGATRFAMLVAHPDCDEAWLEGITQEEIPDLIEQETVVVMEKRPIHWHCGCHENRLMQVLEATFRSDPAALFADQETLEAQCPRCAARYLLRREAMEAHVEKSQNPVSGDRKA